MLLRGDFFPLRSCRCDAIFVMSSTLDSTKTAKTFYTSIGGMGLETIATPLETRALVNAVKSFCSKEDRILDLACGYGRITLPLAKEGFNIEGIDLTPGLIQDAKKRARSMGLNVPFRIGNMLKLSYADGSFDKVVCLWSSFNHLLHRKEQQKALREIHRILASGGMAFIEMLNGEEKRMQEILRREGRGPEKRWWREGVNGLEDSDYTHTRTTLRNICKESGLKKFRAGFKNIAGKRRLVLFLYN